MVGVPVSSLPQERYGGYYPELPEAAVFNAGDWVHWNPVSGFQIVLVCVEVPL